MVMNSAVSGFIKHDYFSILSKQIGSKESRERTDKVAANFKDYSKD